MHIQLKNPLETNEEINERLSKFEKEIDSVEPDQVDFSTSLKERGKSDFCVHMGDPMVQQVLGKCLPKLPTTMVKPIFVNVVFGSLVHCLLVKAAT